MLQTIEKQVHVCKHDRIPKQLVSRPCKARPHEARPCIELCASGIMHVEASLCKSCTLSTRIDSFISMRVFESSTRIIQIVRIVQIF